MSLEGTVMTSGTFKGEGRRLGLWLLTINVRDLKIQLKKKKESRRKNESHIKRDTEKNPV